MGGEPPKGWPAGRPYRCLKQYVSSEEWETHRECCHVKSVPCGVGECDARFTPAEVERLTLHRKRHSTSSGGGQQAAAGEPPQKRRRGRELGRGDGTGQELGVDPASISTPQLQAVVRPRKEEMESAREEPLVTSSPKPSTSLCPSVDDAPAARGLVAEDVDPWWSSIADEDIAALTGPDVSLDDHDIDALLDLCN
ncbi:unnamed protein product [Owenia fusiformis]|uniref:Uncharacterized protein n=1 Tax=Owenia fusiformis TaxID=6347 RepID=A0A8J1TX76_OWEFU|nr:unnamed protein product [Owenia fusiformis]